MEKKVRPLEDYAAVCWEANRAYARYLLGEDVQTSWAEASDEERAWTIKHTARILVVGGSPEGLHRDWCKEKKKQGWKRGIIRDEVEQTHPSLIAYQKLPEEQKMKNVLFHAILESFQGVLVDRNPYLPNVDWLTGEKDHAEQAENT